MLFAIVGTLMDLYVNEDDASKNQVAFRFCLCFSIYTNGKKLLGTKKVEGNIDCLNGIRFFSMCWVVLGHTFYVISLTPWSNSLEVDYVRIFLTYRAQSCAIESSVLGDQKCFGTK